ncbi:hypothetical protein ACIBSV_26915 [Embleya sp. NPDC050154]|uniref:hypothetical protein n=1 Tax=unclassified Embleya TaxID=2699296 RepID=UPI0037B8EB82
MIDPASVPAVPVIVIEMTVHGETAVDGVLVPLAPDEDARAEAIRWVSVKALALGRPVRAVAVEADGTRWPLIVGVDGAVVATDAHPEPARSSAPAARTAPVGETHTAPVEFETVEARPAPAAASAPPAASAPAAPSPATPEPAVAEASVPVASAAAPESSASLARQRHELLVRIRAAADAGNLDEARELSERLVADGGTPPRGAREVRAYVAALAGEPELAARIYAELALESGVDVASDPAAQRYAANAYTSWRRVTRLRASLEVGPLVVEAQMRVRGADDPTTGVATRWLEELRSLG